jgi:hypothetical protein
MKTLRPFSVLLLMPDYAAKTYGEDTYYAHVMGYSPDHAARVAQARATRHCGKKIDDPAHFHPLLVIHGHHDSLEFI